jgi:glycosyltransferase involved in cell wall biosynthesis
MKKTRRLLSIGHSYVVSLNRRLVNEMARLGKDQWEVTAIAPKFMHGDLRAINLEANAQDICNLEAVSVYFSQRIHLMTYGLKLHQVLKESWDLIHCWEEPYVLSGGQVAWGKSVDTPLVFFTAQSNFKRYPPPFSWIENYAMHRASGWICCGELVAQALSPRSGYNLPNRVIPHGVDVDYFSPSAEMKASVRQSLAWHEENMPVIGYLGRLVPEKGLHLLMQVLDRLQTPWRMMFVGTGSMEPEIRQWAEQYGDRVRICTKVNHDQVPQYLNAMDILCAPSQTIPSWREQFGRMIVEAFACGIPVIGSDSGEIPYVIADAGLVVGEKDQEGWIKVLSELLESPAKRQELSLKGLERAHTKFSWAIVASQHLEFFNTLV